MEKSEILVHISAPCRGSDDVRYRAQVEAILGFQTVSRRVITLKPDDEVGEEGAITAATRDRLLHPQSQYQSHCNNIAPQEHGLPVIDASNRPPTVISNETIAPDEQSLSNVQPHSCFRNDSLDSPVSIIPDSQPERLPSDTGNLQDANQQPVPVLDLYSTDVIPPKRGSQTTLSSSQQSVKKTRRDPHNANETNITQRGESPTHSHLPPAQNFPLSLPAEIRPPLPPISKEKFITHVTPTLEMLATRLKGRTYNPLHQTREPGALERGHWCLRIDILQSVAAEDLTVAPNRTNGVQTWDISLFTRFWAFLSQFIREGRAGWGIWCIVEDASDPQLSHDAFKPTVRQLTLKIYTWGEVASHIYLMLYLASERHIRKMGAQWRDGCNEVVVQMP
ncbi:hypothetical protein BDV25DRAFT_154724 [Aspergillus avenaceus]|uniref:Uncharacterized protein n=1 Tax=Aspergillus avenaceus TaxID=36643 RepID=A0A5N6TV94_ASPAV|nr:hypothetical protein BDV25DRAFT_154724 [Aspergillus avenaceus]